MNVTTENTGNLELKVTFSFEKSDYQPKVDQAIKKFRKTVNIPGFRPGMAPMGMVNKMYGRSIMLEELQKMLDENVNNYIRTEKLALLGRPLMSEDTENIDIDNKETFNFTFEMGLRPALNIDLKSLAPVNKYEIELTQEVYEEYVENARKQNFDSQFPDNVSEGDIIMASLMEADENGVAVEGKTAITANIAVDTIADEVLKTSIIGAAKETQFTSTFAGILGSDLEEAAKKTNMPAEALPNLDTNFILTITRIRREGLAEMNQELFDRVLGPGKVEDEAGFEAAFKEEIAKVFENEAHKRFAEDVQMQLLQTEGFELPDNFLIKWVHSNNEKASIEDIKEDYTRSREMIKRDVLIGYLLEQNNLQIEYKDIVNAAKAKIYNQFLQYGVPLQDPELGNFAKSHLEKEENVNEIEAVLKNNLIENLINTEVASTTVAISLDDYKKL